MLKFLTVVYAADEEGGPDVEEETLVNLTNVLYVTPAHDGTSIIHFENSTLHVTESMESIKDSTKDAGAPYGF